MDLVTITLDKYLKHRFYGSNNHEHLNNYIINDIESTTNGIHNNNETNNDYINTPKINHINIDRLQPCCVAIREDMQFIAAGFENSHIYLWSLTNDNHSNSVKINSISTLLAHTGSIYGIEFIKNTDLMLSCSEDHTIRLWCLKNKCNVFIYRGHNYPIWSLDVGPQGNFFASASMDTTARLWSLDTMTPVRIFCGHDDDVECVKFHPNEKYIATGSSDTTIRLWSTSDGKMVRSMVGHKSSVISLSFLPNGKFLASASRDGFIKIWNLATNSSIDELVIPPTSSVAFSLEQNFISTCGLDNILRVYHMDYDELVTVNLKQKQQQKSTSTLKVTEKKSLDFQKLGSNLIQSHFVQKCDKLLVIASPATSKTSGSSSHNNHKKTK